MTSMDPGISRADLVLMARNDWAVHQPTVVQPRGGVCRACPHEGACGVLFRADQVLRQFAAEAREVGGTFIWPAS